MATPIDLSAYKLVAGEPLAAAKVTNMMTAVETWSGASIDPAAMLQKGATAGQYMGWNGTLWAPTSLPTLVAPTMIGPTAWPTTNAALTANTAYLVPVAGIVVPTTISRIGFYINTGGSTGNMDVGIYYSDDEVTFTRLVSKGSTATPAGGGSASSLTITPTVMTPVVGRRWYLALGCSSTTPNFASNGNAVLPTAVQKAASFPLPASLTGITVTLTPLFLFGLI